MRLERQFCVRPPRSECRTRLWGGDIAASKNCAHNGVVNAPVRRSDARSASVHDDIENRRAESSHFSRTSTLGFAPRPRVRLNVDFSNRTLRPDRRPVLRFEQGYRRNNLFSFGPGDTRGRLSLPSRRTGTRSAEHYLLYRRRALVYMQIATCRVRVCRRGWCCEISRPFVRSSRSDVRAIE